ncbi:MAG: hypothetical protein LCH73_06085 [Proteobacteria bacterium]|nr:hypothetical protein [Pseudomonadota bacterium]
MTKYKLNLRPLAVGLLAATLAVGAAAQALRPEVGKPLQQASDLLRSGKAKDAQAKVREAEAVANKTPQEQLMINKMKAAAAQRAGDNASAVAALEALFNSGRQSGAEQAQTAESLAFTYSQMRDLGKANQWAQRAQAAGANSAQFKQLQAYLQGQSGDYTAIARDAAAAVADAEKAGQRPAEADLLRLADAYQRTKNQAGYLSAVEKLLTHYPKKEYWAAVLGRLPSKAGFAARYQVDVLRLKFATDNLTTADEYMELTQLALQAGYVQEAKTVVDKGFASGVLGTGPQAARHQRLRDMVGRQVPQAVNALARQRDEVTKAGDEEGMVRVGAAMAASGQVDEGIKLIDAALDRPKQLRSPEDAQLRLGLAQLQKSSLRATAVQTLRSVRGTDGVADIAKLWVIRAGQR